MLSDDFDGPSAGDDRRDAFISRDDPEMDVVHGRVQTHFANRLSSRI